MATFESQSKYHLADLSGSAKLDEVTKLVNILREDLESDNLSPDQRDNHLETLKILGRDPCNSDPIFTKEGIKTLACYALNSPSPTTSRIASRCLANSMLLQAKTRQIFVDLGLEEKACNKLKDENIEDEFLMSRILFLTTYETNIDLEKLINYNQLAESICKSLSRHANRVTSRSRQEKAEPIEESALVETLKLMFNLTHFCPRRTIAFCSALKELVVLLTQYPVPEKRPLDPPIGSLINAIINLDLDKGVSTLFPSSSPNFFVDHCVKLLDKSIQIYDDEELELNATPLVVLIRKINDLAPQVTQAYLQQLLLPSVKDRQKVLGRTESIPSRLLRQSSNPLTPQLRESISALLYELSGKDTRKFVQNVGYGFASGFLCNHNLPVPENLLDSPDLDREDDDDDEDLINNINPVTGQLLEQEEKILIEDMTEEEKEREAERLFVLFERLKKNKMISVKNPMEAFQQSGKFEDLEDSSNSD